MKKDWITYNSICFLEYNDLQDIFHRSELDFEAIFLCIGRNYVRKNVGVFTVFLLIRLECSNVNTSKVINAWEYSYHSVKPNHEGRLSIRQCSTFAAFFMTFFWFCFVSRWCVPFFSCEQKLISNHLAHTRTMVSKRNFIYIEIRQF